MSDLLPRTPEQSRATVVRLTIPTDANFMGNVFGGELLADVDRVAYITATRHAKANCVTASFDRVDFIAPVHVGEVVDFDAVLTYVGRTSMEVWVSIRSEALEGGPPRLVAEAFVTMVAVDGTGHPIPVRPLSLTTDAERQRFEEGRRRTEARRSARERVRR
ncbi:MAG: acyl-CoA thioesterase [Thermoplasmata archaeon]